MIKKNKKLEIFFKLNEIKDLKLIIYIYFFIISHKIFFPSFLHSYLINLLFIFIPFTNSNSINSSLAYYKYFIFNKFEIFLDSKKKKIK
jgi:hypothetical protein